jgi:hypothetical protein
MEVLDFNGDLCSQTTAAVRAIHCASERIALIGVVDGSAQNYDRGLCEQRGLVFCPRTAAANIL